MIVHSLRAHQPLSTISIPSMIITNQIGYSRNAGGGVPRLFAKSMTTPFMVARGVKNSQKSVAFHNPSVKSCDGGKCHSANLEERNSACRCQETANKTPALGNGYSRCRRRAVFIAILCRRTLRRNRSPAQTPPTRKRGDEAPRPSLSDRRC